MLVMEIGENNVALAIREEPDGYELKENEVIFSEEMQPNERQLYQKVWLNGEWTEGLTQEEIAERKNGRKTLDEFKNEKISELDKSCTAAIYEGFTSSALGEPHQYKCDDEAQRNFSLVKNLFRDALITEIKWTTKDAGPLVHNADQFNQLYIDHALFIGQMQDKYRDYKEQIQAATSMDEVNSIMNSVTWEVTDGTTTV